MADNRSSAWSLTINNPTSADHEEINRARQRGWKVEGQMEKGTEGTYHLQLLVRTPQVRFSAVKKMFSRAHIEPARNVAALANYVSKEDTRVAALPTASDKYPSLSKFWDLVATNLNAGHAEWFPDKDGFDIGTSLEEKRAILYRERKDADIAANPLRFLDEVTATLIAEGYHVESMASNPSVRSAWKKFWRPICFRSMETARQTDTACVQIPTTEISNGEHNHADDSTIQETPERLLAQQHGPDPEGEGSDEGSEESRSTGP